MEVKTECKDCCFAEMQNEIQSGCKVGQLEKLVDIGCDVAKEGTDETHYTYIINGRYCNKKRSKIWMETNVNNPFGQLSKELEIKYDVVIVFDNDNTLDDLDKSLSDLPDPPRVETVHIIHNSDKISYGEVRMWLGKKFGHTTKKWLLTYIVETPRPDYYNAVDFATTRLACGFYVAIKSGETLPKNLFSWINKEVNDNLRQLGLVYGAEGSWYVCSTRIHKYLGGNEAGIIKQENDDEVILPNLPAKIQYWAQVNGNTNLIEEYNE